MTARARELGATDTNFVTTNGLHHPEHRSTAFDLALMARHAMQYGLFNEVVATQERVISRSINQKDTLVRNWNRFLDKYSGADGVKTGYVRQAGRCLVASATRPDQGRPWRLITVVLNTKDTYGDSQRLQDWTRKHFQPLFIAEPGAAVGAMAIAGGRERVVPVSAAALLRPVVRREIAARVQTRLEPAPELRAPINAGQPAGRLVVTADGGEVAGVNVVASAAVEQTWLAASVIPWAGLPVVAGLLIIPGVPRLARAYLRRTRRRRVPNVNRRR
jgi:D-alanyl-D-alanine carboxypeptidase (penicillin-binding protein 5/6)